MHMDTSATPADLAATWIPPRGTHGPFWRWAPLVTQAAGLEPVSLHEGGTPMLGSRLWHGVWWKDEGRNPTGSHKDRALSLAAADARASGARHLAVVSAGSTGLSCAAYAARAGLSATILFTPGTAPHNLVPLQALGATLVEITTDIDTAIAALSALDGRHGIRVCSTTRAANSVQAEAAQTIAYEIVADLGHAPDQVVVPTGGGGTIAAIHDGFSRLRAMGVIDRNPRLIAVVPDRYDTLHRALKEGVDGDAVFSLPPPAGGATVLNKLAHAHPPDGRWALAALRESGGQVITVSDEAALAAVPRLGTNEGLFVEPSSAVALVALDQLDRSGQLAGTTTVALACGHGFRETAALADRTDRRHQVQPDTLEALLARLDG
ncbi:MAG: pyridoxal-phosphate dependent enzyme [Rubellimicrobium sp.]|nr:pyridoxal-phosphate dependent enzyme [Rubellimicrobium sp.]